MGYLIFSFPCLVQDQFCSVRGYFYGVLCVYKWQSWDLSVQISVCETKLLWWSCQSFALGQEWGLSLSQKKWLHCRFPGGAVQEGRAAVLPRTVLAAGTRTRGAERALPSHEAGYGIWTVIVCWGFSILLMEPFHFLFPLRINLRWLLCLEGNTFLIPENRSSALQS